MGTEQGACETSGKDNGIVIGDTANRGVKGSRVIVHDRGPLGGPPGAAGPGMGAIAVETGVSVGAAVSTPAFLKPVPESAHVRCAGEARVARAGGAGVVRAGLH